MSKLLFAVALCAMLLLPAAVFAIDGQVLINQSTVMAGGGFPYRITQPGSYKLTGNLLVPASTDAVIISASHVTLDLNGFSIIGPQTCSGQPRRPVTSCTGPEAGSGITSTGNTGVTIRNGSVTGMGAFGVYITGSGALLEELHINQNTEGIQADGGVVRRCTAESNRDEGIAMSNGTVEGSTAAYNGSSGIIVSSGLVTGSVAYENADGIGAGRSTITNNASFDNQGRGLDVFSSTFGSNSLQGNGTDLHTAAGSTSQNNNNCTGGVC